MVDVLNEFISTSNIEEDNHNKDDVHDVGEYYDKLFEEVKVELYLGCKSFFVSKLLSEVNASESAK